MSTLLLHHPTCQAHMMGPHHPESPQRLQSILNLLQRQSWAEQLSWQLAPQLDLTRFYSIHPKHHIDAVLAMAPAEGLVQLDGDTSLCPDSIAATLHAAGAGVAAVDAVMAGIHQNAFCAVRPPGHHAESTIAMGFCVFNSVALAAERALALGAERVAILDFDVHHGNGTVEIFKDRPEVLVCSSFQYPFYPGRYDDVWADNICLTPLRAGTGSDGFRHAVEHDWRRAVDAHQPDIILVSAGFDAHKDDPLASLMLTDNDFTWVTELVVSLAHQHCAGRVVSMLEGGYDLAALSRSVSCHVDVLRKESAR